jgi:hypothetical protein
MPLRPRRGGSLPSGTFISIRALMANVVLAIGGGNYWARVVCCLYYSMDVRTYITYVGYVHS